MKVVNPDAPEATGGTSTRTLTKTILALTPSRPDLVDAAVVVALAAIAFLGFGNTYDTWQFYFVGLLGVLLGVFAAHLARVLRWHWLTIAPLLIAEFFLLGSALSVRDEALFGALPTLASLQALVHVTVDGWKELLTTLPPVDGAGPFVALPYLMGLVYGAVAFAVARERKRPFLALITPLGLLASVILLGTLQPPAAMPVGLASAGALFLWAAWRYRQRRRLVGTGKSDRTQLLFGTGMLAAALAGAFFLGSVLPGASTQRLVLRTYVQPPVDLSQYASPLVAFRQFSSETMQKFYDQPMVKVEGAPTGSLIRFAILDDYSGRDWSATAGVGPLGFQRVGSVIPNVPVADKPTITVTVDQGYASNAALLAMWVPSLGDTAAVDFAGANLKSHEAAFRFNLASVQGVVVDRLRIGDVVKVVSTPFTSQVTGNPAPGASPIVSPDRYAFVAPAVSRLSGGKTTAWERLMSIATALKAGKWSDGTLPGETQYLPGHGQRRLSEFLASPVLVGSDEQYAAAFALMANQIGYPARVVVGASVPDGGLVKGQNICAWVEVQTADGWVTLPPASFIPDRKQRPDQVPQPVSEDAAATNVPPPNPVRAPGSFDDLADGQLSAAKIDSLLDAPGLLNRLLALLLVIGPPVGGLGLVVAAILGAKALRSRRRRTQGAPAHRVASGWRDILDRARDMGLAIPAGATRLEQSRLIGVPAVAALAEQANTLVLGPEAPEDRAVASFWNDAAATKKAMLGSLSRPKRVIARLNVRSLLPERVSGQPRRAGLKVRVPKLSIPRPRRASRA